MRASIPRSPPTETSSPPRFDATQPRALRFGHDQRGPVPDEYRDFIIQLGGYAMPIEQRLDMLAVGSLQHPVGLNERGHPHRGLVVAELL